MLELGISYAIVTKVKELTETRQYGEALDLLEGQDIFQSFNPQFLRCCGEVYLHNERFYESREALVKAHIMAPESNRVIYDLVYLYLKMGYFSKAEEYKQLYQCYATAEDHGAGFLEYMIKKAHRVDARELLKILRPACEEEYMDEWAFELALLYASLGMVEEMKQECIHLCASFKQSPYVLLAQDLKKGQYDTSNSPFQFPIMEAKEDEEVYASILAIEKPQWEKDYLKINPPEPVILKMQEDDGTDDEEKEAYNFFGIKIPSFSFPKKRAKEEKMEEHDEQENNIQETESHENPENMTEVEATEAQAEGTSIEDIDANENMHSPQQGTENGEMQKKVSAEMGESAHMQTEQTTDETQEQNVSTYIASVMESVAQIEASVEEDLHNPTGYSQGITHTRHGAPGDAGSYSGTEYQSKLYSIEENLSPKERLEKLMRMIEEDRVQEESATYVADPVPEEIDMDEFLMGLVGANTIAEAMVKSYHEEQRENEQ